MQEVLGGRAELTAADIPKLVVAEACFKEALRLHPPAAQVGRDAAHDTIIQVSCWRQLLCVQYMQCMPACAGCARTRLALPAEMLATS